MTWGAIGGAAVSVIGGALLGDKGSQSSVSQQKTLDPRMVPYLFGGNGQTGLLQYGQSALDRSQSPQRQQDWQNIRDRGTSLLGAPVAGNPFSSGYQGLGVGAGPQNAQAQSSGLGILGRSGSAIPQMNMTPVPQPQTQQQQTGPTMDDIIAELQRRAQLQSMYRGWGDAGAGIGDGGNAGVGSNANGDSAGVGAGPM